MVNPRHTISPDERFVSLDAAADFLGCSSKHISNIIRRGELASYQFGPRGVRVKFTDLEAMLVPIKRDKATS